jgi:hypothetical protein
METAIVVVWSIGLAGALGATLILLKESALVIQALGDILDLARRTARAADGIARHLEPASALSELHDPAARTARAAAELRRLLEESSRGGPPGGASTGGG